MSKIIIECKVPAAGVVCDMSIPYEMPLLVTLELMKAAFEGQEGIFLDADTVLCDSKTGSIFNIEMTPEEAKLENGSSLSLV